MKDLKYVFDTTSDDMVELQTAGKECGEIDVFMEQDCSSRSPREDERENAERDVDHDGGYAADSGDDDCGDRPREDDEGDQSEDEQPPAEEEEEEVPKRPTKPRKRKTPINVSSSQPVPAAESTSEFPATSSAPEQTSSSVPQMKKAKRGPPLKITKSGPIPRDVGILSCPYTNRVFEVINNRAYDTSAPPPEPPK
ncbi:hypothetical protein Bca101_056892 [Brassica carinata]